MTTGHPAERFLVALGQRHGNYLSGPARVETLSAVGKQLKVYAQINQTDSVGSVAWSPNGAKLAWVDDEGLSIENANGTGTRKVVRMSRTCVAQCVSGLSFSWSPDGGRIIVGGAGKETDSFLTVDVSTGVTRPIEPPVRFRSYTPLGWTPDGRSIVYVEGNGHAGYASCCTLDVRVATANGSSSRIAYRFPDWMYKGSFPTLSPNGQLIAFVYPVANHDVIRVVSLKSGHIHDIAAIDPTDDIAWSPDSERLAFATAHADASKDVVYTVTTVGGPKHRVGPGTGPSRWLANNELLITRGRLGQQEWASVGGRPEQLLFTAPTGTGITAIDAR